MIAGEITVFKGEKDDPDVYCPALIELTEWGKDPFIEIAADAGKNRIYLRFRMSDLLREIKEIESA